MKNKHFLAAMIAMLISSMVFAQTPVDRLPNGRPVSGWAVELIPVQGGNTTSRRDPTADIMSYAGQLGASRISVAASGFSSAEIRGAGQNMIYNGRAFFRSRGQQRYAFLVSAGVEEIGGFVAGCELAMMVGGRTVLRGQVVSFNQGVRRYHQNAGRDIATRSSLQGTVDLNPGFYPTEFVVGCLRIGAEPPVVRVDFLIRSESEAQPRPFQADELIHLVR